VSEIPDSLREPASLPRPIEWFRPSARELRRALDAGEVTSRALVDVHLAHIAEIDRTLGAFTEVFPQTARTRRGSFAAFERRSTSARARLCER
jgi:Asp-tRNA(Asn)/Glu-tRNA(Gln) amidotransferase A subunit family amidase